MLWTSPGTGDLSWHLVCITDRISLLAFITRKFRVRLEVPSNMFRDSCRVASHVLSHYLTLIFSCPLLWTFLVFVYSVSLPLKHFIPLWSLQNCQSWCPATSFTHITMMWAPGSRWPKCPTYMTTGMVM